MKKQTIFLLCLSAIFAVVLSPACKDKCDDVECQNGGTCDEGVCDCPPGWTGKNCETRVATPGYNCQSGNCISVSDNAQYATLSECQQACTPPPTGRVIFWETTAPGCSGTTEVNIGSTTKAITSTATSAPSCGTSGFATFTLNTGTYNYTISRSGRTRSGTVTITNNGCATIDAAMRQTVTFTPSDIRDIRLDQVGGGNKEFNGDGPDVTVTASYYSSLNPSTDRIEIWVRVFMRARETNSDWTEGTKTYEQLVYTCPAGWTVGSYITRNSFTHGPTEDLSTAMNEYTYSTNPNQSMVSRLEYMGDTSGDDLATGGNIEGECHLHLIRFNPASVCLVRR